MQQPFHIPDPLERRHWTYFCNSTASTDNAWQAWHKPAGINFIHITAMGGGGGGGGATGWVQGVVRNGGGGGGSAAFTNLFVPAMFVPDTLYVKVGRGGAGGAGAASGSAASAGVAGQVTYVSYFPALSTGYVLLSANGGTGGSGATNTTTTTNGGAGGTAIAATNIPLTYTAVRTFNAGITGTQSGPAATINNSSHGTAGASRLNMAGMGGVYKSAVDNFQGENGWGGIGGFVAGENTLGPSSATPASWLANYGVSLPVVLSGQTDLVNFIGWSSAAQPVTASISNVSPAYTTDPGGYGCGGTGGSIGFPGGAGAKGGDGLVIITCG